MPNVLQAVDHAGRLGSPMKGSNDTPVGAPAVSRVAPAKVLPANDAAKRNAANRFASINDFVDCTMRHLTPSEVRVWVILWRHERYGITCASQAAIASRAGISTKQVGRAIAELERRGLLKVVHRGCRIAGPSTYRISAKIRHFSA